MVNDRSTDRSAEIIKRFPIKLIDKRGGKAKNPGAETVNLGIKHASGDYIALIEADIQVERKWLTKLFPYFKNRNVATVSGFVIVSPSKSWVSKLYYLMQRRTLLRAQEKREMADQEKYPITGFSIFRRFALENAGLFDETVRSTDIVLDLKIRSQGYKQICVMSAVAYDIRRYTAKRLVKDCVRKGTAVYQTGGSLLYLHEQLLFRYIFLSPHYFVSLFRAGRSLVALLFPLYALVRYFCTIIGYLRATLRREQRCSDYLRKKRREHEIRLMVNSFRMEIKKLFVRAHPRGMKGDR